MLTRVTLQNYRSFREANVRLSPLTVLVGPNSSGKSSFLEALQPLNQQNRLVAIRDRWQLRTTEAFTLRQDFAEGESAERSLTPRAGTRQKIVEFRAQSFGFQLLHLDLARLRSNNMVQVAEELAGDGSNLVNLFASISRRQQEQVSKQFCALVPSFRDVDFVPSESGNGQHRFRFQDRWNEGVWFPPDQVSDGTVLVLAYVLLQYQTQPLDLIAIEEPERGLHPYLLGELVGLWRKMTRGEIGPRPVQIVLATHSAELLDHLEPSEVRFFTRKEDGSTIVEEAPPDDENWREAYKVYQESLGGMWLSGGLGGVPGR